LIFRLAHGEADGQVFRPRNGAHYVVRNDPAGRYLVVEE
jgi:hypothetical protein